VMELERLATALWVTREFGERAPVEERAGRLHQVKPHVSIAEAADAVREIDEMLAEASTMLG